MYDYLVVHRVPDCDHRMENVCLDCATDWHQQNYHYPLPAGTKLPARSDRKV